MKSCLLLVLAFVLFAAPVVRSDDPPADKEKIQGTWNVVAMEDGGEKAPPEEFKGHKWVITGTTITLSFDKAERGYKLDPSKKPKQLELLAKDGKSRKGIYLLEGDDLKFCWDASDKAVLPTTFSSKGPPSADFRLVVLKREKKKN